MRTDNFQRFAGIYRIEMWLQYKFHNNMDDPGRVRDR